MQKSRLILFLKCLNEKEFEAFSIYINATSTEVKKKKMTIQLLNSIIKYCNSFQELKTTQKIDKNEVFRLVELSLKKTISNRGRDDLMSYLVTVIEEFLILQELKNNPDERSLLLSQVLSKRNAPILFNQISSRLLRRLSQKPLKNIENSFFQWRILHFQYFSTVVSKINQKVQTQLQLLVNQLNEFWLLTNYKYNIEIKNRIDLFGEDYQYLDIEQLKPHFNYDFTSDNHFLLTGYQFIDALTEGKVDVFDEIITWHKDALDATKGGKTTQRTLSERDELFFIHILIINSYSLKSSKGEKNATQQLFKIFKTAIDEGILSNIATIDYHYYLTVIRLALGLNEKQWANQFILKYASTIPTHLQNEIQLYIDWLLSYEQGDKKLYASIIHEIQQTTSSDIYLEIRCRILELQVLYDLSTKDVTYETILNARLGNFNDMLSSQKLMDPNGITIQANKHFIKIVRKLILSKYKKQINKSYMLSFMKSPKLEHVSERFWLLKKLDSIR